MRLALLATAATLIALPALADPPQQPPLQQKLQTLNQAIGDMTNRVTNALGGVQTNLGADVTHIQQATNEVLQEMMRQAADQKKADDAALADAHKDADARVAAEKKADDAKVADLTRQLTEARKPKEPPMCINGPQSPKQLMDLRNLRDFTGPGFPHSEPAPGHK